MIGAARRKARNVAIGKFLPLLQIALTALRSQSGTGRRRGQPPGARRRLLPRRGRIVIGPELPKHFPLIWILANYVLHRIKHPLCQPDDIGALVSCAFGEDGRCRPYIIRTGIVFVVTAIAGENGGARFEGQLGDAAGHVAGLAEEGDGHTLIGRHRSIHGDSDHPVFLERAQYPSRCLLHANDAHAEFAALLHHQLVHARIVEGFDHQVNGHMPAHHHRGDIPRPKVERDDENPFARRQRLIYTGECAGRWCHVLHAPDQFIEGRVGEIEEVRDIAPVVAPGLPGQPLCLWVARWNAENLGHVGDGCAPLGRPGVVHQDSERASDRQPRRPWHAGREPACEPSKIVDQHSLLRRILSRRSSEQRSFSAP